MAEEESAENDDRWKRKRKEKSKPTGGGWSAQEKRMKVNQWYAGELKQIKKKRRKRNK